MHGRRTFRYVATGVLLALVSFLCTASQATPRPARPAPTPYPDSMSALGDSITRASNAADTFGESLGLSWSAGASPIVRSHYDRIRAVNSAISGHNYNDARSGAEMGDLAAQAASAAARKVEHITILIGANDACKPTEPAMTSVTTFRAEFTHAMQILAARLPDATIFVASIPDLGRLWEVGKANADARAAWATYGICPSMLANPLSTAQVDVARRARVRQRVIDYDAVLAGVCAYFGDTCRYDGNAVFNYHFSLSQLSTWDYFHPSTAGQAALAEVTNRAGYRW